MQCTVFDVAHRSKKRNNPDIRRNNDPDQHVHLRILIVELLFLLRDSKFYMILDSVTTQADTELRCPQITLGPFAQDTAQITHDANIHLLSMFVVL